MADTKTIDFKTLVRESEGRDETPEDEHLAYLFSKNRYFKEDDKSGIYSDEQ